MRLKYNIILTNSNSTHVCIYLFTNEKEEGEEECKSQIVINHFKNYLLFIVNIIAK